MFPFRHCSQKCPFRISFNSTLIVVPLRLFNERLHTGENFLGSLRSISDAMTVLEQLGAGYHMAETDIKFAFRIIPIHPSDFPFLGNQFYYDVCLPMALSSSCAIFEAISSSLE